MTNATKVMTPAVVPPTIAPVLVPGGVVPGGVVPGGVVPAGVVPGGVAPEGAVLEGVVPEGQIFTSVMIRLTIAYNYGDTYWKNNITCYLGNMIECIFTLYISCTLS